MPIYEYECLKCGQEFELLRGITANDNDLKCTKCGAEKPRRVVSTFASSGSSDSSGSYAPSGST